MHSATRILALAGLVSALTLAAPAFADTPPNTGSTTQPANDRNLLQYNLPKSKLAISGYDPVAYFPEGGGKPKKGLDTITATHNGITYRFATKPNLDLFNANPSKYEPSHGGWCTYAMGKDGSKVEIDPKSFVISNGRLFLFYKDVFNDTRSSFLKDQSNLTASADKNWKQLSGESPRIPTQKPAALKPTLDAVTAKYSASMPADRKQSYEAAVTKIKDTGVMDTALKAGSKAPDFTLNDAAGKPVALAEMLKQGPVVVTWYRGGWCPYCNLTLQAYQEILPDLKSAGAQLLAISPETPASAAKTSAKGKLDFPLLTDTNDQAARAFGLAYRLPDEFAAMLANSPDVPDSPSGGKELPIAATYVIARDGTIAHAFLDSDYRNRAEPADILAAVQKLNAKP
jgi:peroxiredoxin